MIPKNIRFDCLTRNNKILLYFADGHERFYKKKMFRVYAFKSDTVSTGTETMWDN